MRLVQRVARRVKFYALINAFISGVAGICYAVVQLASIGDARWRWPAVYLTALLRVVTMVKWFEWIQTRKQRILGDKRATLTPAQRSVIYRRILWLVVPTECASFWFAEWFEGHVVPSEALDAASFLSEFALFIPKSLWFELIFDLFHFAAHWGCHANTWLYRHVHKRHHLHLHPCALSTYEQDAFDLCLTNVAPFCLATLLSPSLSALQLQLLFAYKTYVEVAGHCGLEIKGFSFPQMPLVSAATPFCLRVHDHDLHHTHPRWNFAKRFSLWDRVFGTFQPGRPLAE
jgi:sterol desaturase/sphingolipid hydroxylase (fatty acid hydroxylase superfamily)